MSQLYTLAEEKKNEKNKEYLLGQKGRSRTEFKLLHAISLIFKTARIHEEMLYIRDLTLRVRRRDVSDVYVVRSADVGNCISPLRDGR